MGVFWASSRGAPGGQRACASSPPRACAPPRLSCVGVLLRLRFRFGSARRALLSPRGVAACVPLLSPARGGLSLGAARRRAPRWWCVGPCGGGGESEGRKRRRRRKGKGAAPRPAATASGPAAAQQQQPPNDPTSTQQPAPADAQGARNGVVGTLGACAISPSSAHGPRGQEGRGRGRGARRPPKAGARGTSTSSTKEAGVEPGFWEPLGRARLVHLVPTACRRRGATRQEGRRRQGAPPAPTQRAGPKQGAGNPWGVYD